MASASTVASSAPTPTSTSPTFSFKYIIEPSDSAFTLVSRTRKKRRQRDQHQGAPHDGSINGPPGSQAAEALKRATDALRAEKDWLATCSQIVHAAARALPSPIARILCLGLGSPSTSVQARYQLAFLLELRDAVLPNVTQTKQNERETDGEPEPEPEPELEPGNAEAGAAEAQEAQEGGHDSNLGAPAPVQPQPQPQSQPQQPDPVPVTAYDPVFSREDAALLASLGINVLTEEEAKTGIHLALHADASTLAYMPHCDRDLYEELIRVNWPQPVRVRAVSGGGAALPPASSSSPPPPPPLPPPALAHLLLVGNDLNLYAETIPAVRLAADNPYLVRLTPRMASTPLPLLRASPFAFTNIAVSYFNGEAEATEGDAFWDVPVLKPDRNPISKVLRKLKSKRR